MVWIVGKNFIMDMPSQIWTPIGISNKFETVILRFVVAKLWVLHFCNHNIVKFGDNFI